MTWILGISAYYHDSSIALLKDGRMLFAASEERFTRRKHDSRFPALALQAGLAHCGISPSELDYVGFYEKPLLKLDRLLETYLAYAPRGYRSFAQAMPSWLRTKLHVRRDIRQQLQQFGGSYDRRIVFCEHHESHAASAFFPSPFDQAALLTVDGVGEWATTCWGVGQGNSIDLRQELHFPHSLGLLYSALTYFCGFRVNSGEYKLMGLAPFGSPKFYTLMRDHLITLQADGSYQLNMQYFDYCHTLRMTSGKLEQLLGAKRRQPETELRQVDMDLAASIQRVTEEVLLSAARHVHRQTGLDALCMAGGVALNCVANARLLREGPFQRIWIQPAAGDAGGALGVAWLIWHQLLNNERRATPPDSQSASLLGTAIDQEAEMAQLVQSGAVARRMATEDELMRQVAELLSQGQVVGWVQGRMEFGPRALGNRSILADPRLPAMQSILNRKIKHRETFRPFAPAILEERASDYFELPPDADSPYMLFTYPVREERRRSGDSNGPRGGQTQGLQRLAEVRSEVPAVTHVDYSARVQTVSATRFPRFHALLHQFAELTGCPMLINTSFNVRGEPPVRTAAEAYRCFLATEMDALVIGDYLLLREAQPPAAVDASRTLLSDQKEN